MAQDLHSAVESVASAAQGVINATEELPRNLDFLLDIQLQVSVEVGRARMSIQELLKLGQGSVIELSKLAGEHLDVFVNNRLVAKGEAVIVNEKFGVRITEITPPGDRLEGLR